jgi:DHA2 family multidrug resistance protein
MYNTLIKNIRQQSEERYIWLVLIVVVLGTFMASLDSSVVNVAIPKIMKVFSISTDKVQWLVTGYMLTLGIVMPLTGYLSDRYGIKRIFIIALFVFTLGSVSCGMAWSYPLMILARVIQGVGGGMIMPVGMAILYKTVPMGKRGTMMGVWGIASMAAPTLGPVLSGYIVQYMSWRVIFLINLPIGIATILTAIFVLEEVPSQVIGRFDLGGAVSLSAGLLTLLIGLNRAASEGWTSFRVLGLISISIILILYFVRIELRCDNPIIELRVLKNFNYRISVIILCIIIVAMYGVMFIQPIYLQNIKNYKSALIGLTLFPQSLVSGIMMLIGGKIFDQRGARHITIVGIFLSVIGMFLFSTLKINSSFKEIIFVTTLVAAGMGLSMMPAQAASMIDMPQEHISKASAFLRTALQLSGSIGIAVLTAVLQKRQNFYLSKAGNLNNSQIKECLLHAMNDVFLVTITVLLIGVAVAFMLPRKTNSNEGKNKGVTNKCGNN